jgi:uncharacterized protein
MSERTSYEPGTPCWVDLGSPDLDAAVDFYSGLFGWEVPAPPNPEEFGGYRRAKMGGADVAGMMPLMQEGQPPAWTSYFSVVDADATAASIAANGGTQVAEPMDVMDLGRMALFTDPEGAFFGIWQPGTFAGAQRVNEPGALGWNELESRDPAAAKDFYRAVFGWGFEDHEMGEMTYTEWQLDGRAVGGMADIRGRVPDAVPAHWMAYFGCEDADASVARVEELGGEVMFGPIDIPAGRFAMVADPWGAGFAVMRPSEETIARAREQGLA